MRSWGWLAAGIAAGIVLAFAGASARENVDPASYSPGSLRMSRAAATGQTRALARHIWPDREDITLLPDLAVARKGVGSPVHRLESVTNAWQVVCEDARGGALGTMTWNASTGELLAIVAGSRDIGTFGHGFPEMGRSDVDQILKQWMRTLAGTREYGSWRQVREVTQSKAVISEWVGAGRSAHLCIDSSTGELIVFRIARKLPR